MSAAETRDEYRTIVATAAARVGIRMAGGSSDGVLC